MNEKTCQWQLHKFEQWKLDEQPWNAQRKEKPGQLWKYAWYNTLPNKNGWTLL